MRKFIFLIALILVINPYFAIGAVNDLTVSNYSFDTTLDDWIYNGDGNANWQSGGQDGVGGHCYFDIEVGTTYMYHDMISGVNGGEDLTFTIWAYDDDQEIDSVTIYLEWYSSTGYISLHTGSTTNGAPSFNLLTMTETAPSAATRVYLGVMSNDHFNKVHIDNAQVSGPAIPEYNMLLSPLVVFSSIIALSFTVRN